MADLKTMSDSELDAMIKQKSLSSIPDDELDKMIAAKVGPSRAEPKGVIQTIGETYDKYAGAPVRAGFDELVRTTPEFGKERPSVFGNIVGAGKAFANQFGEDPSLAPTGKDIAQKRFGFNDNYRPATTNFSAGKLGFTPEGEGGITQKQLERAAPSPSDAVGVALDVGLDIGNVIPVGTIAKAGAKGVSGGAKLALKGSQAALEAIPVVGDITKGATKTAKSAEKALSSFLNPKQAENFAELSEIASKHGIDISAAPEAVEFGKNSFISRASRVQAEGPLGQQRLEGATKFFQDTTNAFDKRIADASGGEILSRTDAGQHIRDSFDNSISNLFKENEVRYSTIAQQNPGLPIDPKKFGELNDYLIKVADESKKAIGRAFTPQQSQQAQMLLNKIDAIWKEGYTLDGAVDVLQNVGEVAFPKGGQGLMVGPDLKKTRDLYFKLRDTIIDSVETTVPNGVNVATKLRKSNENITKFMKSIEPIEGVVANKNLAPEQVFDRLTKSTNQIDALKSVLPAEDFNKIKGAYMDSLIGTSRSPEGIIQFGTIRNKLGNRANSEIVKKLFSPEELQDLADLGKLAESAGNSIMSTSGTGASNGFLSTIKDLPFRAAGESLIESQKARARGLSLPKEAAAAVRDVTPRPLFGPQAIGAKEALGLRLPQQISIQKRNQDKERGR
jgi:hypothetical protein